MPADEDVPSTVRRSGGRAKRTWSAAHDSAVDSYGEGERAHRTAFSALKHTHEKVGDHWEPKPGGRRGPSDERAADTEARRRTGGSATGGVDVKGATRAELLDRARAAGVTGRSRMTKEQLGEALKRVNDRATRRARETGR